MHSPTLLCRNRREFRDKRETRSEAIVDKINEKLRLEGKGAISSAEAAALAGGALGRPHIAQVLMSKG